MEPKSSGVNDYPIIHSIRTHVLKHGEIDKHRRLVLIIPGNPGAVEFYDEFMKLVHGHSGWPVWGLSHAGHSIIPKHIKWQAPDPEVYSLEGQRQHKVAFINDYVPEDVKIVLIGHSIGAQVVLDIMDRIKPERIIQGMLLFPTIEKMAVSPQGKRLTPILKNWRWLLVMISALIWLLPFSWKTGFIDWLFCKRNRMLRGIPPDCIKRSALNLADPWCTSSALYMAHIEMQEVVELRKDLVEQHLPKLRLYYGATDHWCPKELYYKMKDMFPEHPKIHLCDRGLRHAFIIDGNGEMSEKVSSWLDDLA